MENKDVPVVETDEVRRSESSPTHRQSLKDPDQAYTFLTKIGAADGVHSEVNLKSLRRKVDWRIVPIMFLCYTMQFIDKVSLNYAAVMGLIPDLKLKGNDFSNAATAFFIAYLVAEVPTGEIFSAFDSQAHTDHLQHTYSTKFQQANG
jgi:hypothetical protein